MVAVKGRKVRVRKGTRVIRGGKGAKRFSAVFSKAAAKRPRSYIKLAGLRKP